MPRKTFSQEARAKGYKALLRSTSKKAEGLKAYARKWLREHGYSASIVLLAMMFMAAPAMAQRANTVYVDQFRDRAANVGAMATLAQANCSPDTALPCVVIFDGILAVYAQGSLPTPCAQCIWVSYMTIGAVQVATNAAPAFSTVWPGSVSFPLLATIFNGCTAGNVPYSFNTANTTGMGANASNGLEFCIAGNRYGAIDSNGFYDARFGGGICWSSSTTDSRGSACDTGLSRGAPGEVDCGNGTAADKTCTFKAANIVLTGTCTGCGGGAAVLAGGCNGVATANITNQLGFIQLGTYGATIGACVQGTSFQPVPVRAATIQNLRMAANVAGVGAGSGVFAVYKNGVAQTLTCTIGTGTSCSDTTHTFTTVAGDKIDIRGSTIAAETLAGISFTVEVN